MTGYHIVFASAGKAVLKKHEVSQPATGEVLLENDYTVVSAGSSF